MNERVQTLDLSEISSDGAFNPRTEPYAWSSVVDKNGDDLIPTYLHWFEQDNPVISIGNVPNTNNTNVVSDISSRLQVSIQPLKHKLKGTTMDRHVVNVKFDPVVHQNNGGELIGLLIALRLATKEPTIRKIFTDSNLLLLYWSKGHVRRKTWESMDPAKQKCIEECKDLRAKFESRGGELFFIPGQDNLADLGFHQPKPYSKKNKTQFKRSASKLKASKDDVQTAKKRKTS